jgi:hypothetical protein
MAMTKPVTTGHVTVSSITKSAESNTSASNIETKNVLEGVVEIADVQMLILMIQDY